TPTDAGASGAAGTPASCQTLQSKCSAGSGDEQAFAQSYCGFVDPCCTATGATSTCAGRVAGAAYDYDFDATAGAACLTAIESRQAGGDLCGALATVSGSWNNDSAVLPECAGVFTPRATGSAAAGAVCSSDADCAPGPTGRSMCLFDFFLPSM